MENAKEYVRGYLYKESSASSRVHGGHQPVPEQRARWAGQEMAGAGRGTVACWLESHLLTSMR